MRIRALRLGMPPVVALALLAAAPGPAVAEERPLYIIGSGRMTIYVGTDRFRFCVTGSLDPTTQVLGQWTLRVAGVRGDQIVTTAPWTSTAFNVSYCETVYILGAPSGHLEADFGYVGAYGYFFVHSVGGVDWNSVTGARTHAVDFTP